MQTDALNQQFAIDQKLWFEQEQGLIFLQVNTEKARARVSLHGGQVLSFQPAHAAHDLLFVSSKAYFQQDKSIKGGCPVCWPCFAESQHYQLPFHGFARTESWQVESVELTDECVKLQLSISENEETLKIWPYAFKVTQSIVISDDLSIALKTENTGTESFKITQAIHSYFKVGDITRLSISGLQGKAYLDKVDDFQEKTQQGLIRFDGEVDRIYQRTDGRAEIIDPSLDRVITITDTNSSTTVVWNPWQEISEQSTDLADDSYRNFICVETANAADQVIDVAPSESISMATRYQVKTVSE